MNSETKKSYSRGSYQGRRLKSKPQTGILQKIKAIIAVVVFILVFNLLFPETSDLIAEKISPKFDYQAAFSAIGSAVTGEEKISEVFNGIFTGEFQRQKTTDSTIPVSTQAVNQPVTQTTTQPSEPITTAPSTTASGTVPLDGLLPLETGTMEKLDSSEKSSSILLSATEPSEEEDEPEFFEELLMKLPSTEGEDIEDDAPDTVSYDYVILEFDYTTPLNGTVTSPFGYRIHPITEKRSFHYGIDIAAPSGTEISAFAGGTVESVGYNDVYGNYIFLRHKDGIITFYGHCSEILAQEGQLVLKGENIALVGSTGWSTGAHLHFEVRNGTTILDPAYYVSPEEE